MTLPDLFAPPAPWYEGPIAALDFETTTADPYTARPVSFAYVVVEADGKVGASCSNLVDCGVEIPTEATAVHGITNEMLKAGISPRSAVEIIVTYLDFAAQHGIPVAIMNARFDWPLLMEEAKRETIHIPIVDLLDPALLDKGCDRYRKGKRKLTDLCSLYGIALEDAHTATADAVATARLTRALLRKFQRLRVAHPTSLSGWQACVFEEYRSFLCSDGIRQIPKGWPIPERT